MLGRMRWTLHPMYIHDYNRLMDCVRSRTNPLHQFTPAHFGLYTLHSSGYAPWVAQAKLRIVDTIFTTNDKFLEKKSIVDIVLAENIVGITSRLHRKTWFNRSVVCSAVCLTEYIGSLPKMRPSRRSSAGRKWPPSSTSGRNASIIASPSSTLRVDKYSNWNKRGYMAARKRLASRDLEDWNVDKQLSSLAALTHPTSILGFLTSRTAPLNMAPFRHEPILIT